jgi:hypothetical protein
MENANNTNFAVTEDSNTSFNDDASATRKKSGKGLKMAIVIKA